MKKTCSQTEVKLSLIERKLSEAAYHAKYLDHGIQFVIVSRLECGDFLKEEGSLTDLLGSISSEILRYMEEFEDL